MKRIWKLSVGTSQRAELVILHGSASYAKSKTLNLFLRKKNRSMMRRFCTNTEIVSVWPSNFQSIIRLFDKSTSYEGNVKVHEELTQKVSVLKDKLLRCNGFHEKVIEILESEGTSLFNSYRDGRALIELMEQLAPWPQFALEIFNWRRQQENFAYSIKAEEYTKAISVAGRAKNVDLALELFTEAANNRVKISSTYNALMSAYMINGLSGKCLSLFQKFKKDADCTPTIVTYNILISLFGCLLLIDHMETTFQEIKKLKISPNLGTYNNLIAGYVTAWMWDRMDKTYMMMKENAIHPDAETHLLMLRGYCYSGNLEKMEMMYDLVKYHVCETSIHLIRCMICTYCKSSDPNRVKKIEDLMKCIPEDSYKPWLNVWLIKLYAREGMLEKMEKYVNEAFACHISVKTSWLVRMVIAAYFRCNDVDKLEYFVKQAKSAGWKFCRSLYHCKMAMYGSQNRLVEMENVLTEMKYFNLDITRRTLIILSKAYSQWGYRSKLEQVAGLMCVLGYGFPDAMSLYTGPS